MFHIRGTEVGYVTILVAVLSSMGGFLFGWDTGQISGIVVLPDFIDRFAQTQPDGSKAFNVWIEGVIVALLSVGTLMGVLIGAPVSDKLGRRRAMAVECTVFSIGCIIQVTSFTAWYQVAIGRLITGLGVGALSTAVPTYMAEVVPRQIRGTMIALYQLQITFGILLSYCVNLGMRSYPDSRQWRVVIAMGIGFAIILGVGIFLCPESPRWLIKNGEPEKAKRAIALVRGRTVEEQNEVVEDEYQEMIDGVKAESKIETASWADCFRPEGKILYRTLLGMTLQAGQQLTGANYFFYFGTSIFVSAGVADSFVSQIILGAVNFGVTLFLGLWIIERFGRRRPLIIGALGMCVWLLVFAIAGVKAAPNGEQTSYGIGVLLIVSACFFIVFYASTWAPGIWVFVGESFPTRTRAKQAALATSFNWTFNFLIAFFSPSIATSIHYSYGFVFFGTNLANALIAYLFVYETVDLSLEHVNDMYCDPACNPRNSVKWVPAGFTTRDEAKRAVEEQKLDKTDSQVESA